MRLKKSPLLQLKRVWIEEIDLKESPGARSGDLKVDMDFEPLLAGLDEETYGALRVEIYINKNVKSPKVKGKIVIIGLFDAGSGEGKEPSGSQIPIATALNILYGIARGIVLQRLSFVDPASRVLPVVDLRDLIQDKAREFESKSEEASGEEER